MNFSDDILAAYVDGELDSAVRADIEEAVRKDPSIEQRIARYRALRNQIQAAYAAELEEPVPDRLMTALRTPEPRPAPGVADLEAARAAKARTGRSGTLAAARWRYSLAASVLIAAGAGFLTWRHTHTAIMETVNGILVAQGSLAADLSDRLSGDGSPGSPVRIGLSFVAKSGDYCRTFSFSADAGLACRRAGQWEILALAKQDAMDSGDSQFRTAGSAMSAKVRAAVEQRIAGEPLDRAGELAARDKNWSNTPAPAP
jgi:hypothetical protein